MKQNKAQAPIFERISWQLETLHLQGVMLYLRGLVKREKYKALFREYGFDKWHVTPYELRPYATRLVCEINKITKQGGWQVCEVGCGLGDIIRNIRAEKKLGIDISSNVISCAKMLSEKEDNTLFYVGGVGQAAEEVDRDKCILIAVNFTHSLPKEQIIKEFGEIRNATELKYIVVDEHHNKDGFNHDYDQIMKGLGFMRKKVISDLRDVEVILYERQR